MKMPFKVLICNHQCILMGSMVFFHFFQSMQHKFLTTPSCALLQNRNYSQIRRIIVALRQARKLPLSSTLFKRAP